MSLRLLVLYFLSSDLIFLYFLTSTSRQTDMNRSDSIVNKISNTTTSNPTGLAYHIRSSQEMSRPVFGSDSKTSSASQPLSSTNANVNDARHSRLLGREINLKFQMVFAELKELRDELQKVVNILEMIANSGPSKSKVPRRSPCKAHTPSMASQTDSETSSENGSETTSTSTELF